MSPAGGPTGRLLALAVRLLPAPRRAWGEAMQADFAALEHAADRRRFALGCVRAALVQGAGWGTVAYVALQATAIAFAASVTSGSLLVEIVALLLLAPPALWWIGRGSGALRLGARRSARTGRRVGFGLMTACLLVTVGFITAEIVPRADAGPDAGALCLGVLAFLLAIYTLAILGATSADSRVSSRALGTGAGFGAAAGAAGFALLPFNESFAIHDSWPAAAYSVALALVLVGAPSAAAALTARRTSDFNQGIHAGLCTGVVGALVLFISGVGAVWLRPQWMYSARFDKGADWLPPAAIGVAATYVLALAILPLLALAFAGLGATMGAPSRARWHRVSPATAALAGLAVACALCFPLQHRLLDGRDHTAFGVVGTTDVAFSADGGALLTGNADQTAILWSLAGSARRVVTFRGAAVFSSDGTILASRDLLWNVADPAHPKRIAAFDDGDPAAFSPDGRLLASNKNGKETLWDVSDRAHPRRLGTFTGQWAGFSADGGMFATSADCWWDSTPAVRACGTTLWSSVGGSRPISTVGGGRAVFSPDGRSLATRAIDSTVVLWSLADPSHPRRVATLKTGSDDDPPSALVFSPDSRLLAAGGEEGVMKLWSVADPARAATLPPARSFPNSGQIGVSSTLTTAAFSPDGRTLTTAMGNDLVTRWDVSDLRHAVRTAVFTRQTEGAGVVAFSRDTSTIAGAAIDGSNHVSLWHVR